MIRNIVILCGVLALAVIAGTSALGNVLTKRSPNTAVALWPDNGFAYATAANVMVVADTDLTKQIVPDRLSAQTLAWSRKAFLLEPTASSAIRNLAIALRGEDSDRSQALLEAAHDLYRRDTIAGLMLIEYASKNNDVQKALKYYDELLIRETPAHGNLITILSQVLSRPDVVDDLRLMLSREPGWRNQFWRQANQTPASIENAGMLRLMIAQDGGTVDREVDQILINSLVGSGRFDQAHAVYRAVYEKAGTARTAGSDFKAEPVMPPFDWRLISEGGYGAGIDPKQGVVAMSAIAGSGGVVAERLVQLDPGPYRLVVALDSAPRVSNAGVATLVCASDDRVLARLELTKSKNAFRIDDLGCRYTWLRLSVSAKENANGVDIVVKNVALNRIEG